MSLTINTERFFYKQGEIVRGHVRLNAHPPRAMSSVIVTFEGKGTVTIEEKGDSKRKRNSQQSYFSFAQEIGHREVRPTFDIQDWPFEFQIPTFTIPDGQYGIRKSWLGGDQPHALPPSFQHWSKNPYRETEWECKIAYELGAIASSGRSFKSNTFAKTSINYDQRRLEQNPDPIINQLSRKYTMKTLRFLPDKAEAQPSFADNMQSLFRRSSLPSVDLQMTIYYPTCIYQRGPFPLQLVTVMSPTAFPRPKLLLRRVKVFVNSEICVRTLGMLSEHTDSGDEYRRLLEVKDLDIELSSDGMPFDASILGIDTSQLINTFKSCNIAVESSLDLMVKVKSADKSCTMTVKAPILVLPG
jgi:hypothetical protein